MTLFTIPLPDKLLRTVHPVDLLWQFANGTSLRQSFPKNIDLLLHPTLRGWVFQLPEQLQSKKKKPLIQLFRWRFRAGPVELRQRDTTGFTLFQIALGTFAIAATILSKKGVLP